MDHKRGQRGASLLLFTFVATFVIIPMIGLGIDASVLYWTRAKLSAAIDSAALATARSLNVGLTITAQTANAKAIGQQYFAANFPAGIMGTTLAAGSPNVQVAQTSAHIRTATVTASVSAPLYFMRILHFQAGTISVSGQATRRDANVLLVLDRSGSMNNASNSCSALVSSSQAFVNLFVDGRDQLGLITFSTSSNVDFRPTLAFKSSNPNLNTTLGKMVCVGATSTAQGLTAAYTEIKTTINQPGALNVVLFFTDGQANSVVANFPVKTLVDARYDYVNTSALNNNTPKSSCLSILPLYGLYTDFSRSINTTGVTGGVIDVTPTPIDAGSPYPAVINAPGCSFTQSGAYGAYNPYQGRADVAYIPNLDFFGNSTIGYMPVDVFPAGYTYAGQIRPDSPAGIRYAAMNAADSIALKIRNDPLYTPVIFSIGLAGNEPIPMDLDFMERIANDPRASNFDPTKAQGMFALATDNASLAAAFNQVSSQILRLSK